MFSFRFYLICFNCVTTCTSTTFEYYLISSIVRTHRICSATNLVNIIIKRNSYLSGNVVDSLKGTAVFVKAAGGTKAGDFVNRLLPLLASDSLSDLPAAKFVYHGGTEAGEFVKSTQKQGTNTAAKVAAEFVHKIIKETSANTAVDFLKVSGAKTAANFVKELEINNANSLVSIAAGDWASHVIFGETSIGHLAKSIKASYELGTNDAPSIKDGIYNLSNNVFFIKQ